MIREIEARLIRPPLFALCILAATGCEDTLVYGERSGFNLGIQVNDDPSTPVQVNSGLRRSVFTLAPPTEGEAKIEKEARGEAASMISGFNLQYVEDENLFRGTLTIRTRFASGNAAIDIADGDNAAEAIKSITSVRATFADTASVRRIRTWLKQDKNNLALLKQWAEENKFTAGTTLLRFGKEHELERQAAINDLNIP